MLSVAESARALGVSPQRIRAMIAAGTLPASKIGKAWALKEEDVMGRMAAKPKGGRPKAAERTVLDEVTAFDASYSKELKELYRACKHAFRFRPSAAFLKAAESEEEAAFYMAVADFFLREKQAELVKAGVY